MQAIDYLYIPLLIALLFEVLKVVYKKGKLSSTEFQQSLQRTLSSIFSYILAILFYSVILYEYEVIRSQDGVFSLIAISFAYGIISSFRLIFALLKVNRLFKELLIVGIGVTFSIPISVLIFTLAAEHLIKQLALVLSDNTFRNLCPLDGFFKKTKKHVLERKSYLALSLRVYITAQMLILIYQVYSIGNSITFMLPIEKCLYTCFILLTITILAKSAEKGKLVLYEFVRLILFIMIESSYWYPQEIGLMHLNLAIVLFSFISLNWYLILNFRAIKIGTRVQVLKINKLISRKLNFLTKL